MRVMRQNTGKMQKMRSFRNMRKDVGRIYLRLASIFPCCFAGAIANSQNYYHAQPPFLGCLDREDLYLDDLCESGGGSCLSRPLSFLSGPRGRGWPNNTRRFDGGGKLPRAQSKRQFAASCFLPDPDPYPVTS